MPRRDAFEADSGNDALSPQQQTNDLNHSKYTMGMGHRDQILRDLERRLNEEVDDDFFEEPKKFNTLERVIDVLGLQMMDDLNHYQGSNAARGANFGLDILKNPAYQQLKSQQDIVEGAIEHMAVIHCADLNGSVVQVGRVARQFSEAVLKVRVLRNQVRDIQDGLGHSSSSVHSNGSKNSAPAGTVVSNRSSNAAGMSLRELWLKKLECEATLSLLDKLDVIRSAPAKFDSLLRPPYVRIGAAALVLSDALRTMFTDDVAQVGALHKIMEQLMLRKQRAEEIVWETLSDVIYLRTGNAIRVKSTKTRRYMDDPSTVVSSSHSVSSASRQRLTRLTSMESRAAEDTGSVATDGMINPFVGSHRRSRFAIDADLNESDDAGSGDDDESFSSLFSIEEDQLDHVNANESGRIDKLPTRISKPLLQSSKSFGSVPSENNGPILPGAFTKVNVMIPIPVLEAELDLEQDERRCLEEVALSGGTTDVQNLYISAARRHHGSQSSRAVPRYLSPVLAGKILIECLYLLKRLDDVERIIGEGLEKEIRRIVQREQARTFTRLERLKRKQTSVELAGNPTKQLREFRQHLTGLLSAFGCVMIRLSHIAEILRYRIRNDPEMLLKFDSPSTVLRSVLSNGYDIMQREIKNFLKACLVTSESPRDAVVDASQGSSAYEKNLFSLGIVEDHARSGGPQSISSATLTNVMEMTTTKFVTNILCVKTKTEPQIRHALSFRRSVARWTSENDAIKRELAMLTGEDMSTASFISSNEVTSIAYLDNVIQKELLPVLQEEAVNGTVKGLEHRDAFDPVLDRALYSRPGSNDPQDVDMCKACQAMYDSTSPLFLALHRLPHGGIMYTPLVAVLEHVMLTFISRVKQQMNKICKKRTASTLLDDEEKQGSLSSIMEKRRPFSLLLQAYVAGDTLESNHESVDLGKSTSVGGLTPLSPPTTDTTPHKSNSVANKLSLDDVIDSVDNEEIILNYEVAKMHSLFGFDGSERALNVTLSSDEDLMKAACLAHSLLKLASLLANRLRVRHDVIGSSKTLTATRTLQEAIKTIQRCGTKMAKYCRLEMILQCLSRLANVPLSSALVARDAVRIPSSVNELGEYLTSASDNLRDAAANAVAAYTFASLEQYIPYFLMQIVRIVAQGKGAVSKAHLTMNGIESLDRSGSVLYRDLKGATSFDNSFWDVELAAVCFERSASFIALMELEMEELVAYTEKNMGDFSEDDYVIIFSMTGPRRRGDASRYYMLKRRLQ